MFAIWGNVQGKSVMHKRIEFGPFEAALPTQKATNPLIFRCLWTAFDYLSAYKEQDDIVVGGLVDFQMYQYPQACQKSHKWVMRKVLPVEERLNNFPFPETTGNTIDNPVEVSFKIPSYVFIGDDITALKIGVWDAAKEEWSTDYI